MYVCAKSLANIYKIMPETSEKRNLISGNDHFKALVGEFKQHLPLNWRDQVLEKFPDLNTAEGRKSLDNIFYGRSAADVEVILYMADLAGHNQRNPKT